MNRKTVMTCAAAGAICLVSLLLPEVTLAARDRAMRSRVESVETDEVALSLLTELTVTEKLELVGDRSATVIPLASGKRMDVKAAENHIHEILPMGEGARILSAEASLKVASDGSTMILWRVAIQDESAWVYTMVFDDETGYLMGVELDVPRGYMEKYGWESSEPLPDAGEGGGPGWPDLYLICSGFSDLIFSNLNLGLTLDYIETIAPGVYYLHLSNGLVLYAEATNVDGIHISLNT